MVDVEGIEPPSEEEEDGYEVGEAQEPAGVEGADFVVEEEPCFDEKAHADKAMGGDGKHGEEAPTPVDMAQEVFVIIHMNSEQDEIEDDDKATPG